MTLSPPNGHWTISSRWIVLPFTGEQLLELGKPWLDVSLGDLEDCTFPFPELHILGMALDQYFDYLLSLRVAAFLGEYARELHPRTAVEIAKFRPALDNGLAETRQPCGQTAIELDSLIDVGAIQGGLGLTLQALVAVAKRRRSDHAGSSSALALWWLAGIFPG